MIPHNMPSFSIDESNATKRVISSRWVAQGQEVESFENELCHYFDLPKGHAVVVSSGSAALYLALWSLNSKNKTIALPIYACNALRNAAVLCGGHPVYMDTDAFGPNFDFNFSNQFSCDILVAVSMFGIPAKLPKKYSFTLIEDIAQSFGSKIEGVKIGLRGELGICSFSATKIITSGGQGGAIISKKIELIEKIKDYRNFDSREDDKLRFNFQLSDLNAAVGRCQLAKVHKFIEKRKLIYDIYNQYNLPLLCGGNDNEPVRYRAILKCDEPLHLIDLLAKEGIKAIVPVKEGELLCQFTKAPNALNLTRSTVSLPIYPDLSIKNAKKIAATINLFKFSKGQKF